MVREIAIGYDCFLLLGFQMLLHPIDSPNPPQTVARFYFHLIPFGLKDPPKGFPNLADVLFHVFKALVLQKLDQGVVRDVMAFGVQVQQDVLPGFQEGGLLLRRQGIVPRTQDTEIDAQGPNLLDPHHSFLGHRVGKQLLSPLEIHQQPHDERHSGRDGGG